MTKLNKALMASTAIAFACGLAMPAAAQDPSEAPGVVSSQKKVKLKLYGQISRQFGFVGDGEDVNFKQGENPNTSTRMGIVGSGKVTNDITLKTILEYSVTSSAAGGGDQRFNQQGSNSFGIRHLDVILSSKKFGSVWMGRGATSSDGTAEVNLGGTGSARLSGAYQAVQSYVLREEGNPSNTVAVGDFFDTFDGANRQNRLRYDTPSLFGFMLGADLIDRGNFGGALKYDGKIAGTQIAGAVGYCHTNGGSAGAGSGTCFNPANGALTNSQVDNIDQLDGSISFKLPIGLGATFSGGTQWIDESSTTPDVNNPYSLTPSVFYTTKVTELGSTTFEYAYQYAKNIAGDGTEGQGHQVTALQRVDSVGGDYFLVFNYIDVGGTAENWDNLWYFGGGFRQRF